MTHVEYANGLREFAAFIEAHEEITVPLSLSCSTFVDVPKEEQKAHAAQVAKALGNVNKVVFQDNLILVHEFNPLLSYKVWYSRDAVCERIVTGVREIPEHILPAREETFVPAHAEEIVEWRCHPILAPKVLETVQPITATVNRPESEEWKAQV